MNSLENSETTIQVEALTHFHIVELKINKLLILFDSVVNPPATPQKKTKLLFSLSWGFPAAVYKVPCSSLLSKWLVLDIKKGKNVKVAVLGRNAESGKRPWAVAHG